MLTIFTKSHAVHNCYGCIEPRSVCALPARRLYSLDFCLSSWSTAHNLGLVTPNHKGCAHIQCPKINVKYGLALLVFLYQLLLIIYSQHLFLGSAYPSTVHRIVAYEVLKAYFCDFGVAPVFYECRP